MIASRSAELSLAEVPVMNYSLARRVAAVFVLDDPLLAKVVAACAGLSAPAAKCGSAARGLPGAGGGCQQGGGAAERPGPGLVGTVQAGRGGPATRGARGGRCRRRRPR